MPRRETILLVEDEELLRTLVRNVLRRHCYNVIDAQNGGEAFLLCEQYKGKLPLMLTDVIMPRMSGRELAQRVSQLRRHFVFTAADHAGSAAAQSKGSVGCPLAVAGAIDARV